MTTWQRPEWLTRALAQTERRPLPAPSEAISPILVAAGEIRAAQPMDGQGGARLVIILAADEGQHWADTMLLSNVVESATSKDVRLDPEETGLTFPILAETDIVGPMFGVQFGPRLGRVDSELLLQLQIVQRSDDLNVLGDRRGLPVRSRRENRVRWKERELDTMHTLAGECFAELTLWDEARPSVLVDDALFRIEDSAAPEALSSLLQLNELGHLEIPAEALLAEGNELSPWLHALDPGQLVALEPLWREALRSTPVPATIPSLETEWQPRRREDDDSILKRYLSARVDRGERSIRLATRAEHWEAAEPSDLKGVAAKLILGTRGIVQISLELVEETA